MISNRDNVVIPNLMQGKVCVVTGASSGLGYESCYALAEMGARVLMVVRSAEKGELAISKIQNKIKNSTLTLVLADLSSLESIHRAIDDILGKAKQIDVLINNAGTVSSARVLSRDGYELNFAVNYLAHFYLTMGLFPALSRSAESRVINISSNNHFKGKLNFNDINLDKNYNILKAYNQSKLAMVLFTYEFDRRLKQENLSHMTVNCADPGFNHTGIGEKNTGWLHRYLWKLRKGLKRRSAEWGVLNQVYLATSSEAGEINGKYWVDFKPVKSSVLSYDLILAKNLWDISCEMCGFETNTRLNEIF